MMSKAQIEQIVKAISTLPPEKVTEVYDFVLFLQARYGHPLPIDTGDAWSEEDIHDLVIATLTYAGQTIWAEEEADDTAG